MIRKKWYFNSIGILTMGLLAACSGNQAKSGANAGKRPNIVVILADDLGYSDIGAYGGEIQTPNLDKLAANGVRFTQFYNTSRCCPTRASLLSGVYNHQAGIGEMTTDRNEPGYRGFLSKDVVTLAEVLKESGYSTGMSGKWHVSTTIVQPTREEHLKWLNHQASHPYFSPVDQYPVNRGFERHFGNIFGVVDYFDPFSLVSGETPIESVPEGYYHTDAINDSAASYVREFSKRDQPFFLYVAHTAPHWPLQALPEDIKKYEDTYKVGWDAIREARYKRMVKMGLIDSARTPLSPRIGAELKWEDNPHKEWDAHAMAVHAAMVDRMDQGIGRIIDALKETGELDNTIIIFLSDNGASPEDCMRYGPGFDRPSETRDGRKIHYPVDKDVLPGPQTSFASIGERWANVVNTPYRYAKAESYEGGVRTPVIVHWPAGIRNKGGFTSQIGHVMDFMPTFMDLAGAQYPETYNGNKIRPFTGVSLLPALVGSKAAQERVLYNEHFGARFVREGNWKLVSLAKDTTWRLYDVSKDDSELNDLSAQYPEQVARLSEQWHNWALNNQVLPKPGKK
ncbi:MAG TPA: arylsulfatase [Flavihumibacter sp.]